MSAKTSVKYYRPPNQNTATIRRVISVLVVVALVIVAAGAASFTAANQLMRQEPGQLQSFSSNVMPRFSVISFQSLDEQTTLSGWFFPAQGDPVSTVILVHDSGKNRLQFDIDMPRFYEFFVTNHYNVISFDLRHTGKSEGHLSAYGYAEWEDVIAAIQYARRFTTTKDVLLFGFGSGVTASLFAWSRLPEQVVTSAVDGSGPGAGAGTGGDTGGSSEDTGLALSAIDREIAGLGFDRSYVRGILLDTPCVQPDNYIQANPLSTPAHIVPEWYFLPFYAILRAFAADVWVVILVDGLTFGIVDAKFFGVIAMFGAIAVMALAPWLDTSKVRSGAYRPKFRMWFRFLVLDFVVLTWVGAMPTEYPYDWISLIASTYWFAYFLVILPLLGATEKPEPIPASIEEDFNSHYGNPAE